MPAGGGSARQITDGETQELFPAWSPDGKQLLFSSENGIWVVGSSGGEPRYLTASREKDADRRGAYKADWSPDGEWIVLEAYPGLWRVSPNGGEPEPLTYGSDLAPRWSEDGNRIYFIRGAETGFNIWERSQDGATRPLTDLAGRRGSLGVADLASDGERLYFLWEENLGDIWVMDVDDK